MDYEGGDLHDNGEAHLRDTDDRFALDALVADVGKGNVIDAELLDGSPIEGHELDEMDEVQAALVASHCFQMLFDYEVENQRGADANPEEGVWSGTVEGFRFVITRDEVGDLILDFIPENQ